MKQQVIEILNRYAKDGRNYEIENAFLAAAAEVQALAAQPAQQQCRTDGRCQYAIDSGAEGMGHCPKGKCVMPVQQQEPVDGATLAGLHASISILSALVDEQRQLLVEVEDVCGRDVYGARFEDGESSLIDKVRAHIAAIAPTPQPAQQQECEACKRKDTLLEMSLATIEALREQPAQQEPVESLQEIARLHDRLLNVQAGCQLVPIEPTQEMIKAAVAESQNDATSLGGHHRRRWAAMLDAAPAFEHQSCDWSQGPDPSMPDTWTGKCGAVWTFTDGNPKENGMRFCPECGKKLNMLTGGAA